MVDVGAVVIDPDLFGPGIFAGGLAVEEKDIGFDAIGVEDAGGEAEDGVEIGGLHKFLANGLAGTTFEEDIVREDDCSLAGGFQHRFDVLDEVELFVAGGDPEVLTIVGEVFFFLFACFVGKCHAAFFTKRRIG